MASVNQTAFLLRDLCSNEGQSKTSTERSVAQALFQNSTQPPRSKTTLRSVFSWKPTWRDVSVTCSTATYRSSEQWESTSGGLVCCESFTETSSSGVVLSTETESRHSVCTVPRLAASKRSGLTEASGSVCQAGCRSPSYAEQRVDHR
jgi:hypothetical protein